MGSNIKFERSVSLTAPASPIVCIRVYERAGQCEVDVDDVVAIESVIYDYYQSHIDNHDPIGPDHKDLIKDDWVFNFRQVERRMLITETACGFVEDPTDDKSVCDNLYYVTFVEKALFESNREELFAHWKRQAAEEKQRRSRNGD